jgi:protoheme IX farnesyltransferase
MKDYIELAKPRIALMVMATTALGFLVAGGRPGSRLFWTLAGVGLVAASCGALNQLIERRQDALMKRTCRRPIPAGRLQGPEALLFGLLLAILGLLLLAIKSGLPAFSIATMTLILYLLGYTPLKTLSPHSTWLGAAAGATPPLLGWAAAQGNLPGQAWILFAIQFLWQIPHFLAMFWIHREDYARAGFKVMPAVDPGGGLTACQIALHSFSILPASLLPSFCGMAGPGYGIGALLLGTAYLGVGLRASWTLAAIDTRRLFLASLAYLPLLFGMLLFGGV